ncbi:MAG: endonuclease/exonuclease/phosphatase family protein [Gammaproteobacteria bacterium]|nr:endonuclease/exonuclease/phosphatase family protein [Gammaproteobacteria bacterium]
MQWLAAGGAAIVISWTLLPLLRSEAWWIRTFDFPRVQIAGATIVAIVAYVAVAGADGIADWVLLAALAGCLVYQSLLIGSYTPIRAKQARDAKNPDPADCVSLLVANVLTPNRNARRLLEIVTERDPDVLLFVETDDWWQAQLDVLDEKYPYSVKHPLDNLYGMHLYSRLELVDPQLKFLVEDGIPSIHGGLMLRSGHCVQIHCVHPTPPSPTENPESTERDAELLVVAKTVAESKTPAIVFGDLNDVAWSATTRLFQKISGMLDPRIGRGMFSTFHAKYPFLRWPLDHVFFSPDFTVSALARLPAFGSDHFPICISLCYTPEKEAEHEHPKPDSEDRALAEEKIEQADVQDEPEPVDDAVNRPREG